MKNVLLADAISIHFSYQQIKVKLSKNTFLHCIENPARILASYREGAKDDVKGHVKQKRTPWY